MLTANQWLARAGAQGHAEAALRLAEHYHFMEAIWRRRFRRSERAWCAKDAIPGEKFQGFEGIERDYKTAAFWYRIAAERGNVKAALRLGRILETGKAGLPRDVAEAFIPYARAAAAGDETAAIRMGRLSVRRKSGG